MPHATPTSSALRDELSALSDAVLDISTMSDVDHVLQRVVDVARIFVNAEYAALGMLDPTETQFAHFAFSGMTPEKVRAIGALPSGKGVVSVGLDDGQPLRLRHVADHHRSVGFPEHHPPMDSFLGVPVKHGQRVLGNLYLTNKRDEAEFSAADEALAALFARHAALALHNARLHEALSRSESRYRRLTEGAPELLLALDPAGRLTFVNERAPEVVGCEPEQLIGKPLAELVADSDRPLLQLHLHDMERGVPHAEFALRVRHASGKERLLDVSLRKVVVGDDVAYQGVARDVSARHALTGEIADRTRELRTTRQEQRELRDLVALVFQAQEEERARIAGDLHDTTVQTLTAIGRHLRSLGHGPALPDAVAEDLQELSQAALAEADELRRLSRNLRPSVLDHLGLEAALADLCDRLRADDVTVELSVEGPAARLGERPRTVLFRIAQEALTNVRRHAAASRVDVRLQVGRDAAELTVRDDGGGFDVVEAARGPRGGRLGLAGMRERAVMIQGALEVDSIPGEGTTLTARVPLGG